eukprot:1194263-Prorocentrum_minimum.AAC.2
MSGARGTRASRACPEPTGNQEPAGVAEEARGGLEGLLTRMRVSLGRRGARGAPHQDVGVAEKAVEGHTAAAGLHLPQGTRGGLEGLLTRMRASLRRRVRDTPRRPDSTSRRGLEGG